MQSIHISSRLGIVFVALSQKKLKLPNKNLKRVNLVSFQNHVSSRHIEKKLAPPYHFEKILFWHPSSLPLRPS